MTCQESHPGTLLGGEPESVTIVYSQDDLPEPACGWEDLIYETWRDNQFDRALNDRAPDQEAAA